MKDMPTNGIIHLVATPALGQPSRDLRAVSFGPFLARADVRKRFIGSLAARLVVSQGGRLPSLTIAPFALDAGSEFDGMPGRRARARHYLGAAP